MGESSGAPEYTVSAFGHPYVQEEDFVSKFTDEMYATAASSHPGLDTGEPDAPLRQPWGEIHKIARRMAGGLAEAGIGHGDAIGILAGMPVDIAPACQAHLDARRVGHHAASADPAHRPGRVGPGHRDRHRHDLRRKPSSSVHRSTRPSRCWRSAASPS